MIETEKHKGTKVEIVIDRKHLKSPDETTGAALYVLGEVKPGYTLFREVCGPHDDEPVPNDGAPIHVHEHEKFYSSLDVINPGGESWKPPL